MQGKQRKAKLLCRRQSWVSSNCPDVSYKPAADAEHTALKHTLLALRLQPPQALPLQLTDWNPLLASC